MQMIHLMSLLSDIFFSFHHLNDCFTFNSAQQWVGKEMNFMVYNNLYYTVNMIPSAHVQRQYAVTRCLFNIASTWKRSLVFALHVRY